VSSRYLAELADAARDDRWSSIETMVTLNRFSAQLFIEISLRPSVFLSRNVQEETPELPRRCLSFPARGGGARGYLTSVAIKARCYITAGAGN